ncbi:allophanate hydrolase [Solimonas terrae]|uniref:Allophanate hydrolase n=1 Tax=Solimonas terrae TaxID=1396819 RepID=A0A6M2BUB7_9GAMM|nr:allophanate hydrolase [Solimonas terrae]NGY05845.1 allophanate hydrolase [Solimonas terrae]
MLPRILTIDELQARYRDGSLTPLQLVDEILRRITAGTDPAVWISRVPDAALRDAAQDLMRGAAPGADQPLWGIPFAVKDNIDCAGLDTTAACPAFAYRPPDDAAVVARLRAAGALLIGKTNLDQFATGLNGTRSPYGAPRSVFDARYISGGSSSGSAVAVASGQVCFSLGTDTAGSGRVPAAFNNLIGIKPTRGLLPTHGVVPACRSLDCVTVFAACTADADRVRRIAQGDDARDPYARTAPQQRLPTSGFRFAILKPSEREFFADAQSAQRYADAIARLTALGGMAVEFDYRPFRDAAALLYAGGFVAERLEPLRAFVEQHADTMDPVVRGIIGGAQGVSAAELFADFNALAALRRQAEKAWADFDLMLLPTAPTLYSVEQMQADPIRLNSRLGLYTNFVNLLDYCALAVPAGFRDDGLPFGVSLIAPAFHDDALAALGERLHRATQCGLGVDRSAAIAEPSAPIAVPADERIVIAVVGAHLSGMPLNRELTEPGGSLLRRARTAAHYRFYVLPDTTPKKPGLVQAPGFDGPGIDVELWSLPAAAFGRFVSRIPSPLGIGKLRLEDGSEVSGFLCEAHAVSGAQEITALGGWRAYIAGIQT